MVLLPLRDSHVCSKLLRGDRNNSIITQCIRQSIQTLLTNTIITCLPCSLMLNLSSLPNNFIINIKQHLQQNTKQPIDKLWQLPYHP
uniref:Putative ovule protein n=1 Tax=Solanum chacoense TaxID=4108 RepID=A0A0V0GQA8_SOLCH